ncbi:MAG: T9SS type A sorting domain-containing protein [Bacteroidia bacterium]|nr:T9SS type A sorting domain-containing protein [Bacteroidia bacterium]
MKIIFLILFIISSSIITKGQARSIDSELITITPKQGDSVVSRKNGVYIAKYIIKNNGPDTITNNDKYSLKLVFSNVNYNSFINFFSRNINPGYTDTVDVSYKMIWDTDANNASFCTNLTIFNPYYDTIKNESDITNNISCLTVKHISKLEVNGIIQLNTLVYPNPFYDFININLGESKANNRIEFYNISGIKILNFELEYSNNKIDLSFLPSGIYLIKIVAEKSLLVKKLIKL